MSNVQSVVVRDHYGAPQLVPTSERVILAVGAKDDPAASTPTDDASLISLLKAILSSNQSLSKSSNEYTIVPVFVDSVTGTVAIGDVKGVLFEFSYDFDGEINGLSTAGSSIASRYFEAPSGGTLTGMTYKVNAGTLTMFKMIAA